MTNPLVGKFFHSFDDNKVIIWQGQITDQVREDTFLIQTYDWFIGMNVVSKIVTLKDMANWQFYSTDEAMRDWYDYKYKHPTLG